MSKWKPSDKFCLKDQQEKACLNNHPVILSGWHHHHHHLQYQHNYCDHPLSPHRHDHHHHLHHPDQHPQHHHPLHHSHHRQHQYCYCHHHHYQNHQQGNGHHHLSLHWHHHCYCNLIFLLVTIVIMTAYWMLTVYHILPQRLYINYLIKSSQLPCKVSINTLTWQMRKLRLKEGEKRPRSQN